MTRSELYESMHRLVVAATGLAGTAVIPADEKGPRPGAPFIDIRIDNFGRRRGRDERTHSDVEDAGGEGIVVNICGQRSAVVRLGAYRDGAADYLEAVKRAQFIDSIRETTIDADGIAIADVGDVSNVSEMRGTDWEEQAQLTMTVRYVVEYTDVVAPVETITTTGAGDLLGMTITV